MTRRSHLAIGVSTLALVALAWYFLWPRQAPAPAEQVGVRTFLAFPVSVAHDSVILDEAEWLTGDAASRAMREAGLCPDGEPCEPPNGYYIRNVSPEAERYTVPDGFEVIMQTWSHDEQGSYNWSQPVPYAVFLGRASDYRSLPFHATVRGNELVRLEEQYVP